MGYQQVKQKEGSQNVITITVNRSPLLFRCFLGILVLLIIFTPIMAAYFQIEFRRGLNFWLLLTCVIFWGLGIHLFKMLYWNTYGKEKICIDQDRLVYESNFNWFGSKKKVLKNKQLEIKITPVSQEQLATGTLTIKNQNQLIRTSIILHIRELIELQQLIGTSINRA